MVGLKPCPFCGGSAKRNKNKYTGDMTMVSCTSCGAEAFERKWNRRANQPSPPAPADDSGAMTPEEIRLENLKQMAAYDGQIVSFECCEPYYLASCDHCGWVGSSELCGTDSFGDDSDVYCPRCSASGADCGKVATSVTTPPAPKVTVRQAALALYEAFPSAHALPPEVKRHAGSGNFFTALLILAEIEALSGDAS